MYLQLKNKELRVTLEETDAHITYTGNWPISFLPAGEQNSDGLCLFFIDSSHNVPTTFPPRARGHVAREAPGDGRPGRVPALRTVTQHCTQGGHRGCQCTWKNVQNSG